MQSGEFLSPDRAHRPEGGASSATDFTTNQLGAVRTRGPRAVLFWDGCSGVNRE